MVVTDPPNPLADLTRRVLSAGGVQQMHEPAMQAASSLALDLGRRLGSGSDWAGNGRPPQTTLDPTGKEGDGW